MDSAHRVLLENVLLQERDIQILAFWVGHSRPGLVPTSPRATYPQGLQVREVGLGAEEHVVGHAEALPHTQVVEQGGLCQGAAHLKHHHICGHTSGGPEL